MHKTINCKGKLVELSSPIVMGILNCTPDSFYDGGRLATNKHVLAQTKKMLTEGATIIDIGAYSSRPGANDVSEEEELNRILPIVKLLVAEFPEIILSIDTFRSEVANQCIENGAAIINDISAGLLDNNMLATIAKHKVPYMLMHMKGNPRTMQNNTEYKNLLTDIIFYFSERIAAARTLGINDLIIDPGFGFSKTMEQNYEVLQKLNLLSTFEVPILAGLSRKSMIYKPLNSTPEFALNGTTALNMIALDKGATILRVHDVKEAMECIQLHNQLS